MIFLAIDFSVIKPDFGLIFWTTIIFGLFWLLIGKYAFGPIANALKVREDEIQGSLDEAKKAREEMANLNAENEKILAETREERSKILKEAKDTKESIINEAKETARAEAQKIANSAKMEIEAEKKAAIADIKSQVGTMALDIAEKVIKKELNGSPEHESLVARFVDDIKLN